MWTRFMDMHSGGGQKLPQSLIFIEAEEALATVVFVKQLGRNPYHVTCSTCGPDYSINGEEPTLQEASGYDRGCRWDMDQQKYVERRAEDYRGQYYKTIEEFVGSDDVLVIRKDQITVSMKDITEGYMNSLREWYNE